MPLPARLTPTPPWAAAAAAARSVNQQQNHPQRQAPVAASCVRTSSGACASAAQPGVCAARGWSDRPCCCQALQSVTNSGCCEAPGSCNPRPQSRPARNLSLVWALCVDAATPRAAAALLLPSTLCARGLPARRGSSLVVGGKAAHTLTEEYVPCSRARVWGWPLYSPTTGAAHARHAAHLGGQPLLGMHLAAALERYCDATAF